MYKPLIISLAATGIVPTKADSPHLPTTPEEIAADCAACAAAGASVVHLHARDERGAPAYEREIYQDILTQVRAGCPDLVICVTTSGRVVSEFEKRADVLELEGTAKPDMASLTLGSMNFPNQASVNSPEMIQRLADRMRERCIVPELEIFELGMIDYAKFLIKRGVLREPFYFNLLLGSLGTTSATPLNLALMVNALPQDAIWAAGGIGRFQLRVNAMAIAAGGNVRVGLEDNLYLDIRTRELASNLQLVGRVATIARAMGREVATARDARRQIGLAELSA